MKTCRLYASFVSPLQFLSSVAFYEILLILLNIIPADVKIASLIYPTNLKKKVWKQIENVSTAQFVVVLSTDHRNQQLHKRMNINLMSYV